VSDEKSREWLTAGDETRKLKPVAKEGKNKVKGEVGFIDRSRVNR